MIEHTERHNEESDFEQPQGSEISIKEILGYITRRKYTILVIFFVFLSIAYVNHKLITPQYRAQAILMITRTSNSPFDTYFSFQSESDTKKDAELLKSMPVAELMVQELLKSPQKDSLEFFQKRRYRAPLSVWFSKNLLGFNDNNQSIRNQHQIQTSEDRLRQYAVEMSGRIQVQNVRETNLLKISVVSPFADESVFLTNTLSRVYKRTSINRNSEKYFQTNRYVASMLEEQAKEVEQTDKKLAQYMKDNEIFEFTGNVQQLLGQVTDANAKYNEIMAEYHIAQNSLDFLENKLSETDKALSSRIAQSVNAKLGTILEEIRTREAEYVRMVSEKGADNTEVKTKKQQLDGVKTRYELLSRSKIAGEIGYAGKTQKNNFNLISEKLQIERKLNNLSFSAGEYSRLKQINEARIKLLPTKQQDFLKLQRDADVARKTYVSLREKLDQSRIMLASEVGEVSIIGNAFRPSVPENASPNKSILMALVFAGLLSFGYVFIAETLDDTVKDELFFKHYGFNTFAIIPFIYQNDDKPFSEIQSLLSVLNRFKHRVFKKINIVNSKSSPSGISANPVRFTPLLTEKLSSRFAESFRMLRTALIYTRIDNPLKSIIVSGTSIGEGKSTICSNIAAAFALNGKKILLVDCDLRLAMQHNIFNLQREQGLTDYLFSEQKTIDDSFFKQTSIENLFLLTAGKKIPNPNEVLGSVKMQELIKELEGKFDKVFFDSPPLFLSDAAQLAHSVDGILLTARLNYTERRSLKEYVTDGFLKSHILGIALIDPRKPKAYGYGKYGYGKYGYGYGDEEN